MNSSIRSIYHVFPKNMCHTDDIEKMIARTFAAIPHGLIEEMTGVKTRYFVGEEEYASDLATQASDGAILQSKLARDDIDLLIFASASQDIIEPATANIVQKNLGLKCPVFDIKNACNSFMNAIDVADGLIKSEKYKNILICSGETPSRAIKFDVENKIAFKHYFAGYTFGDAGAAMILSREMNLKKGIRFSHFYSDGSEWDIATIMGGGSRYPHDSEKNYFCGNPGRIRDKFLSLEYHDFDRGLHELGWQREDLQGVYIHQVAMSNFEAISKALKIPREKCQIILPETGNIASCCIIASLSIATKSHKIQPGDKIALIGFASGFSYGIIFHEF